MGCFQVFEDHEGIEADILRRLAGLGGRPEAAPAGAGTPGRQRRQLWLRPPQHPHHLQPDRGPALGGPPAGAGHRPGAGGGAAGVPLAALSRGLPPGGAGGGRGPSAAWDPSGTDLLPAPVKISAPLLDKPTCPVYNQNTPPPGGVIAVDFSLQGRQSRPSGNSPLCSEFAPHSRRGAQRPSWAEQTEITR